MPRQTIASTRSTLRSAREYHAHAELDLVNALDAIRAEPSSFQARVRLEDAQKRLEYHTQNLIDAAYARQNLLRGRVKRALRGVAAAEAEA